MVAPHLESFSSTGSGLFAAVYASSTQGSSLSAPTVHTCSATATGYTPTAMAASEEPHPHVATRVGSRGMVVFPKASSSVTGKESETAAAVGAVGAVAVGVAAGATPRNANGKKGGGGKRGDAEGMAYRHIELQTNLGD